MRILCRRVYLGVRICTMRRWVRHKCVFKYNFGGRLQLDAWARKKVIFSQKILSPSATYVFSLRILKTPNSQRVRYCKNLAHEIKVSSFFTVLKKIEENPASKKCKDMQWVTNVLNPTVPPHKC